MLQCFKLEKCHGWSWRDCCPLLNTEELLSSQGVAGNAATTQTCLHRENGETSFLSSWLSPRTFCKPCSAKASSASAGVPRPHPFSALPSRCSVSSCAVLLVLLVVRGARVIFCEGGYRGEGRLGRTGAAQTWRVKPSNRG